MGSLKKSFVKSLPFSFGDMRQSPFSLIYHLKRVSDISHSGLYIKNETVVKLFVNHIENNKKNAMNLYKGQFQEEIN